ncbi:putative reverse transcriptase domain-containing protein [Tanacetum coccineum]
MLVLILILTGGFEGGPKEDHADYPADGGDSDDESFEDDNDDDDANDKDEEAFEDEDDDEEEEEHLAPAESFAVPVVDPVPSAGDTKAFETDESVPTPPSPRSPQIVIPLSQTRLRRAWKTVKPQTPIPFPFEAKVARLLALPTSPPSPLTPLSSLLPYIPSPPLPVSSLPLPLPSPLTTSPTYAEAPLGYRAARIRMRAASPPLLVPSTSYRSDIPEAEMLPRKRACFTTPVSRFEVKESSAAAAARQPGPTLKADLRRDRTSSLQTQLTTTLGRIQTLKARDLEPQDEPTEAGSSYKSRNGDDSHDSGTGRRKQVSTVRECTYTDFLKMFPEKSNEVEKYVIGLPDMIHGSVKASKPKTMQEAIEFATELMDQKILTPAERPGEKKPYEGSKPLCPKCNYHYDGQCPPKCANCKRTGHFKINCPKLKNINQGNQDDNGNAVATAYDVGNAGKNLDSNVVTGTFLLNNRYAFILFDTGANRSFVSAAFSSLIDIVTSTLNHDYDVELADRKIIGVNTIIRGCTLNFLNHPFNIDLMPVELGSLTS